MAQNPFGRYCPQGLPKNHSQVNTSINFTKGWETEQTYG